MKLGLGILVSLVLLAAPAEASIVYVCDLDLCRADDRGRGVERLTTDGAQSGGYSRPSVSRDGTRIAYRRGDPGRVFTAQLTASGLADARRIGPHPSGPPDATQYDVALAPGGARVAWVEHRIDVVFNTIAYRPFTAAFDGSDAQRPSDNTSRPFVAWFDDATLIRNGLPDGAPPGSGVDQGLCRTMTSCQADEAAPIAFDPGGRALRHPAVAPDGRTVVATASTSTERSGTDLAGAIVLFDVASGQPLRELTAGPEDADATFSPDGATVAFTRGGAIWTVPAGGGTPRRLIARGTFPAWGAGGARTLSAPGRADARRLRRGLPVRVDGAAAGDRVVATLTAGGRRLARAARRAAAAGAVTLTLRARPRALGRRATLRLSVRVTPRSGSSVRLGRRIAYRRG